MADLIKSEDGAVAETFKDAATQFDDMGIWATYLYSKSSYERYMHWEATLDAISALKSSIVAVRKMVETAHGSPLPRTSGASKFSIITAPGDSSEFQDFLTLAVQAVESFPAAAEQARGDGFVSARFATFCKTTSSFMDRLDVCMNDAMMLVV